MLFTKSRIYEKNLFFLEDEPSYNYETFYIPPDNVGEDKRSILLSPCQNQPTLLVCIAAARGYTDLVRYYLIKADYKITYECIATYAVCYNKPRMIGILPEYISYWFYMGKYTKTQILDILSCCKTQKLEDDKVVNLYLSTLW